MKNQIEKSGKTVDEAIWNGVQEMGLSLDEVDIEIIQKGSSGLLGIGAKPAIVRLTEKEHEALDIKSIFETESDAKHEEKARTARRESDIRKEYAPKQERKYSYDYSADDQANSNIAPTYPVPKPAPRKTDYSESLENLENAGADSNYGTQKIDEPEINYTEECAKNNTATVFLSDLLEHMGVEANVLAAETDSGLKIKIDTESAGVLIGHRGETLDALQYLTLLVANRHRGQSEYARVSIDTQGYREKREEVLVRLAKSKASTVRTSGRPYKFEPMSPYERRIIHSTLQSNSHVTTHSEGVEPHRYVIVTATHPQGARRNRRPRA